jgi:hypothetical protein
VLYHHATVPFSHALLLYHHATVPPDQYTVFEFHQPIAESSDVIVFDNHQPIPEFFQSKLLPDHHQITTKEPDAFHPQTINQFKTFKFFPQLNTLIHAQVNSVPFHKYKECKRALCSISIGPLFISNQRDTLTSQITNKADNNDNPNK